MADRFPLIANSATNKIEELAANDNLNLDGNDIVNVENITIAGSLTAGGLSFPTTNGTSGEQLTSDGAGNVTWAAAGTGGGSGSSTFTGLTDTPANMNGQAGKYLKVSAGANGLEFTDINYADLTNQPSIPSAYGDSDVDTHLNQSNPTSGHVLSWNGSDYAWVAQSGGGGGGVTINNNADNRLITGSATAGTLNAESNITFDGDHLKLEDNKKIKFGSNNIADLYGFDTGVDRGLKLEIESDGDSKAFAWYVIQDLGTTNGGSEVTMALQTDGTLCDRHQYVRSLSGDLLQLAYTINSREYVGRVISTNSNVTVEQGTVTGMQLGDAITIYNYGASPISINQGSGVALILAGTNSGGTRAIAGTGVATILCIDNTGNNFVVTGSGVT